MTIPEIVKLGIDYAREHPDDPQAIECLRAFADLRNAVESLSQRP